MAFFEFPHTRSYDSDLGWLIKDYHDLVEDYNTLVDSNQDIQNRMTALETLYDNIMSGDFPPEIKSAFYNWMQANAQGIIMEMVKTVAFGITDDGHFVASIPGQWSDIIFKTTGYDYTNALMPEYGHLVLIY